MFGDTVEECEIKAQAVANELAFWFKAVGLCLNTKKSEVMGIGFTPRPLQVCTEYVMPTKKIKFLGCHIQSNLGRDNHVEEVSKYIRISAARIRNEGRHLCVYD